MGWSKTGTTSLQHFLYINRMNLHTHGYCYPSSHIIDKSVFNYYYENHIFSLQCFHGNLNKWMKLKDWKYYRKHIYEEIIDKGFINNILSAESFIYEHSDNLKFWKLNFNIKAIYYLRNYFDWLVSQQKEFIKYFLSPDVFTFDINRNYPILASVRHHLQLFGRAKCIFVDFDEVRQTDNLITNFLGHIGLTNYNNLIFENNKNETLPDAALNFSYQLSLIPFNRSEATSIKNDLANINFSKYSDFISNFLPENIYNLDDYAKYALKFQGALLNDRYWLEKNISRSEELQKIKYKDLPPDIQFYILENLSEKSREIIFNKIPTAKKSSPSTPFLPSMLNFYSYRDNILPLYQKYCEMILNK